MQQSKHICPHKLQKYSKNISVINKTYSTVKAVSIYFCLSDFKVFFAQTQIVSKYYNVTVSATDHIVPELFIFNIICLNFGHKEVDLQWATPVKQ